MEREDQVWAEVAVAPDQIVAEMWQEYLADHEIPSMLEPGDVTSILGVSSMPVRLLVAEAALDEAEGLLEEFEAAGVDQAALAEAAEQAEPEPGEAEMIAAVEADVEADSERDQERG